MTYTERLRPPVLWWLVASLVAATFVIAVAVFLPGWIVLLSLCVAVLVVVGMMWAFTASVRVDGAGVAAGRARLDWPYVGEVTALTKDEVRHRLGAGADPRAYVVYRPFVDEAVEIVVDDPADPHPYWLVSTRDAAAVLAVVESARADA